MTEACLHRGSLPCNSARQCGAAWVAGVGAGPFLPGRLGLARTVRAVRPRRPSHAVYNNIQADETASPVPGDETPPAQRHRRPACAHHQGAPLCWPRRLTCRQHVSKGGMQRIQGHFESPLVRMAPALLPPEAAQAQCDGLQPRRHVTVAAALKPCCPSTPPQASPCACIWAGPATTCGACLQPCMI